MVTAGYRLDDRQWSLPSLADGPARVVEVWDDNTDVDNISDGVPELLDDKTSFPPTYMNHEWKRNFLGEWAPEDSLADTKPIRKVR